MLIEILTLVMVAQNPVAGPPVNPRPHTQPVARSPDGTVLGTVGAADANEIEASTLATTKASDSDVKAYATMLLHDHQQSLATGTGLAKELHIALLLPADSAMAREHTREMAELNVLSGAAFDKSFVQFVVSSHKAMIAKVNGGLLTQATRPRVKEFVRQQLPTLTTHRETGEKWLAAHP
jgi:putative membrane protein